MWKRLFLSFFFSCAIVAFLSGAPIAHAYKPIDPQALSDEIDSFFAQGATGYLVWQYSGDLSGTYFENDDYSFFRDQAPGEQICEVLKEKSATPGKFVGVNIWSAGKYPGSALQDHFSWLKNTCGVSVIRIFAKEDAGGPAGAKNALDAAQAADVKLIIAIGDYSNGGGGIPKGAGKAWYAGGYQSEYLPYVNQVLAQTKGHAALYGYELANEPHCGGDATALSAYTSWVTAISGILKSGSGQIGIGQMASQPTTRCDTPPGDFATSNGVGNITMTSAHYYNAAEKDSALLALGESKKLGKMFYIGEASIGGSKSKKLYIYKGIDDQPDTNAKIAAATRYMMTCANNLKLGGDVGLSPEPIEGKYRGAVCPDNNACIVDVAATAYINHSSTTIPLFKLQDAKAPRSGSGRRFDDLEGFFGASSKELKSAASIKDQLSQDLSSGTNRKENGFQDQCVRTVNFLKTIKSLCENEPPTPPTVNTLPTPFTTPKPTPKTYFKCALDIEVPQYSRDKDKKQIFYSDVLQMVNSISGDTKSFCDLHLPSNPSQWRDEDARLAQALDYVHRVETITPKAFKPAYIVRYVTSPKLNPGEGVGSSMLDRYIAWFAPEKPASGSASRNRIIVSKVYVPANVATSGVSGMEADTSFTSNIIAGLNPFISQTTVNTIKENRNSIEYPTIAGAMNRDITIGAQDYDPQTGSSIVCPECTDKDALETILAKKINADIAFKKSASSMSPYFATLFADEQDLDCTATNLAGEQAKTKKQTINPVGSGDPVDEIGVPVKALLQAKAGNSHDNLEVRTYLLLPEEYRNIRDYEEQFSNALFTHNATNEPSFVMTSPAPLAQGKTEWAYKYLQMGDTKPKAGTGETIHISSPTSKKIIGQNLVGIDPETGKPQSTTVQVEGKIVGPDDTTFNINPLVPGGKIARGIWELVCHILKPSDSTKSYAPYEGIEKFLTKGSDACFGTATPTPPPTLCVPAPVTLSCDNFRPGQEAHSLASFTPAATDQETACSLNGSQSGTGQDAHISSGLVALAVKVGKATCVPAEVLIGVVAKESKGMATESKEMSGDPKELVIRNGCDYTSGDPSNMTKDCGAYQYTQGQLFNQIKDSTYGKDITVCLAALGLAPASLDYKNVTPWQFDTRTVGVSMCVAAVNMWRGTQFTAHRDCTPSVNTLESLPLEEIRNGVLVFHGYPNDNDGAWVNYLSFIDQYKFFVQQVRNQVRSCIQ